MRLKAVRRRSMCRALGGSMISGAMLLAACTSGTELRATQEPSAAVQDVEAVEAVSLNRGKDLSDELLESLNAEFAAAVAAPMGTLFDASQPVEARQSAATAILSAASGMDVSTAEMQSLQRRLTRRVLLIQAGMNAAAVPAGVAGGAAIQQPVVDSAKHVRSALERMRNGQLWFGYLHLDELESGTAPASVMQQVRRNLTVSDSMEDAQRTFLQKPELTGLSAVLDRAIAALSYEADPASAVRDQQKAIDGLVSSLLAYEQSQASADAETARQNWRTLREQFSGAADVLRPVVNYNYFNHNLHFTVSENLLSRLVADFRSESGSIADCIMGAWVTGSQSTDVNVRADILPSNTTARFDLLVNGNTRSNTRAQKDPATVWTSGNHYFWINKSVDFDGRKIVSGPARFSVDTNSQTTGLATKYDRVPIIRGIVRRIASREIASSRAEADALTGNRIRDEALPKFEDETNRQFAESNSKLDKTMESLERHGVAPDSISARSSNTHLALSTRTIGGTRIGGSVQPPSDLPGTGAAVQLHESALNNAIDSLGFQGRTIAEKDFAKELETALSDLFQREIKLTDKEPKPAPEGEEPEPPTDFVFSKTDPIRVRFAGGQIILVLTTGVRQEGREEIPEQIITIPISMTLEGDKVVLDPGMIGVASRVEADRLKQTTRANQIRRLLSKKIVRRELSPTVDLQAAGDKTLPVTVNAIQLADGWLSAAFQ